MWMPDPNSPKPSLTLAGWASLVKTRLRPGGVYAVNLYHRKEKPFEVRLAIKRLRGAFSNLLEVRPGEGQTTVIAAGCFLRSPGEARIMIRKLPPRLSRGLRHIKMLSIKNMLLFLVM